MRFTRISIGHRVMSGASCIAATRSPVAVVVRLMTAGASEEDVLSEYPRLVVEDGRETLGFAALSLDDRVVPLTS